MLERMPLFIASKSQKEAVPIIFHGDLTLKLLPKAKVVTEKRKQAKPPTSVSLKRRKGKSVASPVCHLYLNYFPFFAHLTSLH